MFTRGTIRQRELANQVRDFSGLSWDKITPTDIDGFIDFGNRAFVFIETKYADAPLPRGQGLALERLCDQLNRVVPCLVLVVSHRSDTDIDVAQCRVVMWRYKSGWEHPKSEPTTRAVIDNWLVFLGFYEYREK